MRIALGLVLIGGVANASPVATLSADVDGDGTADAIELSDDGILHLGKTGQVTLTDSIKKATLSVGPVQGKPAAVAHVVTPRGEEGFVLVRGASGWQIAWRGEVGGVGLDAEYAVEVTGTPAGVLRYQSRPGVRRCDGKPAYLFAEGFDGTAFHRRKLPIDVPADAPVLTAKVDGDKPSAPMLYSAKWASIEAGADDAGGLSKPTELDDGRADTVWRITGDGEGQFFTFDTRGAGAHAKELRVVSGDQASAAALDKSSRIKGLAIVSAQGAWHVDVPDAAREPVGTAFTVELPQAISGCVTVVLAGAYGHGPLSIAELEVYAEGERSGGGEAMLVKIVAEDRDGAQNAAAALARRGAASVPAIEAELAKAGDDGARTRLVRVLVAIKDPAVAPSLAHAASAGWVDGDDLIAVARALGALHQVRELHDLAAKQDLPVEVRLAAAGAIEVSLPDGVTSLVELAGVGPRPLRHLVIERLAAAPAATLVAAAQSASTPAGAGDLWRASARAARIDASARAPTLDAMLAALPGAPDYERRYRLVDGIAMLGDSAALHKLDAALATIPDATALRQVAAFAIGASPRADALDFVTSLARDADPGVRLAALGALMQAGDDAANPWHAPSPDGIDRVIITALSGDTWSDVRIRAAQALGNRCERLGPAKALADAAGADHDLKVRTESLAALVQCHGPGVADLLAKMWDDDKAPLELRTRAISLAVALGDAALASKLVARFNTWRGAALESKEAVELATQSAYAIGRLGPPGAAAALVDALDDSAFPEIVGAAAAGLGSLGAACPATAKGKLRLLARTDDQQVRLPAQRALGTCGK